MLTSTKTSCVNPPGILYALKVADSESGQTTNASEDRQSNFSFKLLLFWIRTSNFGAEYEGSYFWGQFEPCTLVVLGTGCRDSQLSVNLALPEVRP